MCEECCFMSNATLGFGSLSGLSQPLVYWDLGSGIEHPRGRLPCPRCDGLGDAPIIHDWPSERFANEGLANLAEDFLSGLSLRTKSHLRMRRIYHGLTPPLDMPLWLLR